MNIDLFGHWKGGAVKDAGDEAIRKYGANALNNINIGPLESAYGATKEDVANYIKRQQQSAINSDPLVQSLAVKAGVPGFESGIANWGETRVGTLTRLQQAVEGKEEATRQKLRTEQIGDEGRVHGRQLEVLGIQNQQENNRLSSQIKAEGQRLEAQLASQTNNLKAQIESDNNRYAHTSKENRLDRRHQQELADGRNDLSLQIQIMQNDLADKRMEYDRETNRLDRRDKAIAQLMQGIGQLGGAFAL